MTLPWFHVHQIIDKRAIKVLTLVFCLSAIMGYGCSSSKLYTHPLSVSPKADSAAEVVFFRESAAMGALVGFPVYLDNKPLVTLRDGTFVKVYLTPGTYTLRVGEFDEKGWSRAAIRKVHFATNRAYYILLQLGYDLRLLDDEEAQSLRVKLKPFGGDTLTADRYKSKIDPDSSVLDRAEWLVEDQGGGLRPTSKQLSSQWVDITMGGIMAFPEKGPALSLDLTNKSAQTLEVIVSFLSPDPAQRCEITKQIARGQSELFQCPQKSLTSNVDYPVNMAIYTASVQGDRALVESPKTKFYFSEKDARAFEQLIKTLE